MIVVPLSSQTDGIFPGEAIITLNGTPSKAKADEIATTAKPRLQNKAGTVSTSDLAAVEKAVLLQLGIRR